MDTLSFSLLVERTLCRNGIRVAHVVTVCRCSLWLELTAWTICAMGMGVESILLFLKGLVVSRFADALLIMRDEGRVHERHCRMNNMVVVSHCLFLIACFYLSFFQ